MWDAFATESNEFEDEDRLHVVLSSPEIFALLGNKGSLHGGSFRLILEKATGASCLVDWKSEKVRRLLNAADWDAPKEYLRDIPSVWTFWDEEEFWDCHNHSKLFIEICAANKLGIHFSW